MVVISVSKIRVCQTFLVSERLLFILFSLSLSLFHTVMTALSLPMAPFQALLPTSLWTSLTFNTRLMYSFHHHSPAFPQHSFIISLPLTTYSPTLFSPHDPVILAYPCGSAKKASNRVGPHDLCRELAKLAQDQSNDPGRTMPRLVLLGVALECQCSLGSGWRRED